ncbi:MAG: sulfotransferase domain-containing protein [Phormidesmis sp.]
MPQRLFSVSPPAYRLFNRARQRVRPLYESVRQKHLRERHSADYLLLSLTNCGRTWLRVILGRAMQLHYDIEKINLHDLFAFSEAVPTIPSIKPMHEKYGQFGNRYDGQKVILLVRDPRDAIVSRYHQHKASLGFDRLDQYVCEGPDLAAYIQFYNDWQTHRDRAEDLLVVRYEDMKADTYPEIERIFQFLDLPVTPAEIRAAIDYASFKNMRKMEVEGSDQLNAGVMSSRKIDRPETFKVRKGVIGGYTSELSEESMAFVDGLVNTQLNPIYGYH